MICKPSTLALVAVALALAAPPGQGQVPRPRSQAVDAPDELQFARELPERQRDLMERDLERLRVAQERQQDLQEQALDRQHELATRQQAWMDAQLDGWTAPSTDEAFFQQRPPAPWAQGDPADSLYRVAREALNRGDYRRAAQLFNDITRRYPGSSYAYVSGYYEAFSRYRIGTTEELEAGERALEALPARDVPAARGWRNDDTDVNGLRTRIRGALAMRGDAGAAEQVEASARRAGSSCDQEDLMVRVEALNALTQMDAAAAMPILRRVLERRDECLGELRRRAVFMLARRGDADATTLLISTARNDPNATVRSEAIGFLGRMPGDAGVSTLEDILRTSDDERIQRSAVRALMISDNTRARASLRGLLDRRDAPEALRIQVLDAYARDRSSPDDADYLRALYTHAESDRFKMALIGAIARIGGRDNQEWLVGLVKNASEPTQLRSAALQRLGRSDTPITDLARMYDAADSRSLRQQLLQALAGRKEPEATDKLIDVAKTSTDPEMRRQAIYYLSRRNDPRATRLLMELIEK